MWSFCKGPIELANVERWVLEHGEADPPSGLSGAPRKSAYEVTVVDRFHRLARRDFERRGYVTVWERPLTTGNVARPKVIDVSLRTALAQFRLDLGDLLSRKREAIGVVAALQLGCALLEHLQPRALAILIADRRQG